MTKTQALAMLAAMESNSIPGSAVLSFPNGGAASYAVQLDTSHVYTGTQLGQIASYCATNALTISAQFTAFGVT
jgi:hypothetical protein